MHDGARACACECLLMALNVRSRLASLLSLPFDVFALTEVRTPAPLFVLSLALPPLLVLSRLGPPLLLRPLPSL